MARLLQEMGRQHLENRTLKDANQQLLAQNAALVEQVLVLQASKKGKKQSSVEALTSPQVLRRTPTAKQQSRT
jgi:hypothetical protein